MGRINVNMLMGNNTSSWTPDLVFRQSCVRPIDEGRDVTRIEELGPSRPDEPWGNDDLDMTSSFLGETEFGALFFPSSCSSSQL